MKRSWILALAFGLVLVLAVPAGAGKPQCDPTVPYPAPTPEHPACQADEPAPEDPDPIWGTPCGGDVVEGVSEFTVELGGRRSGLPSNACVDVMSDAGQWTVEVEVIQGTLRSMAVHIRDSVAPGDGCFTGGSCGLGLRDIPEENPFTLTMGMDNIPGAYVNACNVFPDDNYFGEWYFSELDGWVFYEDFEPDLPSPLAFMPSISGSNDAKVKLTVTFPEYTTD